VGGTLARFGQNAHGAIDLFAPNATLSFGRSSLLEGRFIGKNNRMDKSSTFRHPECGNGIPERGEECDDGNRIACDGCSPTCTVERCGDDVVCGSRGEECDPPGSSPAACGGRLCASDCTCEPPRCGDGIKNRPEEECDPPGAATCPPTSPGGAFVACNDDCTCPRGGECGDGVKGPGEECDGADAAACTSGKCLGNCTCDPCGDGIRDAGEQCDPPGSLSCPNGDECAFNCLCPPPLPPTCGDGHVNQPQEECDGADDAACPGQCTDTCTCPTGRFCSLTQGAYGAPGGAANGATGLVTQNPGILPVTIGAPGDLSLTVQDQASLICFMPCGGTPAVLCTGLGCSGDMLIDACSNPPILDFDSSGNGSSGGQGGGTLTGQTIAAKLNVALSDLNVPGIPTGLRNFVLPQQLCTTNGTFPIDPDVADGITTVADLLTLADQALRNSLAFNQNDPITRSDIAAALDAINRGFDNCASVVTCP
jgi:cysteine-rich repeat protein